MLQPSGPSIQFCACSGSVQQSKTSSRGASTTRVMTNSRSDGVATFAPPASSAVGIVPLLLEFLYVLIQPFVARVPEAAVVLRPVGDLLEGGRLEPARPPLRLAA